MMLRYFDRNNATCLLTSVNGNVECQRTTALLLPMSLIIMTMAVLALLLRCKLPDLTNAIHAIRANPTSITRLMRGALPTKLSHLLHAIFATATLFH